MHSTLLSLNPLELFFIGATILSLIFNILQWRDRKRYREPLYNSLNALFNDVKTKSNNAIFVYNTLFNESNPHKDVKTLRWEYGLFVQWVHGHLQGFQEQLVGLLVLLKPQDKDGQETFRSTDYGLTEKEKDVRDDYLDRLKASGEAHKSENAD